MRVLVFVFRVISGLLVAAFCLCHLSSLLEWNLRYPLGDDRFEAALGKERAAAIHAYTGRWLRALSCEQHWNMFGNVGTSSDVPLIVLYRKDGKRVLLHSELEPALKNAAQGVDYFTSKLSDEQREVEWPLNIGNGRIRKIEDNVLSGPEGYSFARMSYVRVRLREYLAAGGASLNDFQRIDLFRLRVMHPDGESPARLGGASWVMVYEPRMDPDWRNP
ncbi:MAG: hypothetical protein KBG84_04475 [Planctomycetes bacterium]|nr:hypothetical protein [Planctomycetota bacterium]